ncbi:DNA replication complex GINS protein PSF2 [Cimex lectularius]|uniref:DNA replication complex GINS protein PSF2 n=1 Tax=Cimex lectularius TaxID=79782 RepID=A0A8I6RE06_CIMLE|nr:DNA replication complex GINS protein PSF2 [Cimex lectularius]
MRRLSSIGKRRGRMNIAEIEYLAEQEEITIIPKFSDQRVIHLISGDIGPFRAGVPCVVPIWVAINLRKRHKCTLVLPDWMDPAVLEIKVEEEKTSRVFTKMPSDHYLGIAHLLFSNALEDIANSDQIRTLLKDLWDVRVSKARSSADSFLKNGGRHAGIDYLTQLEICTLRPLLLDALDTVFKLSAPQDPLNFMNVSSFTSQSQSQSQQASTSSHSEL